MKKSFLLIALVSMVSAVLLAGCEKKEPAPPAEAPSTNAPAAP
ncbi:MAG: hypothetical protein AAB380_04375 [Verrucomicrobiota bacterium]